MQTTRYSDPAVFLRKAGRLLSTAEARHNLMFGIAGTLLRRPDVYQSFSLWLTEHAGTSVAAATITPPYNLVVADATDEALADLARAVAAGGDRIPGVTANVPTVDRFVQLWSDLTGASAELKMAQGVFALGDVTSIANPPGRARPANPTDRLQLIEWMEAFQREALPHHAVVLEQVERAVDIRLTGRPDSDLWVWERDATVVSMAGYGSPTPNGIRVGPVYTPPELRGLGYASGLVSELSRWLLHSGRSFCFLYTDLDNPSSNSIYRRIGYQQVAESADYEFLYRG